MTAHDHSKFVPGCYRCDLSRDEEAKYVGSQEALVDLVENIIEDAQTEPQFTTREHALMGAGVITRTWLTSHDAEVERRAWDEGYAQAVNDHLLQYDASDDTPNPYREEATQ